MTDGSWQESGEFAQRVVAAFGAHKHKTIATLRKDGAPRISGTEASFRDGAVWFGAMHGVKALDLLRDGRFALHSAPLGVTEEDLLDAKVSGVAVDVTDEDERARYGVTGDSHLFRGEIREAVLTSIQGKQLLVESWHPGRGYERRLRD
jgi:hypothetical protein